MSTKRGAAQGQRRSFAALLRGYRDAAGLTQEALAERAALSVRGLKYLEQGARAPQTDSVRRLADALALAPSDRALFQEAARRLSTVRAGMPPGGAGHAAFVGRAPELVLLAAHLAGSPEAPPPPVLLLAGEPGIGKSRLLAQAAELASAAGWCVLAGGCRSRGGQEPYAPILEALDAALQGRAPAQLRADLRGCAWLVRLLPELADAPIEPLPPWQVAPEQERRLLFKAVARFLANLAGPAGTLLVLDDLQWAGADALDLLATLVRAADCPVRVLGAYRDSEVATADPLAVTLAELAQRGLAHRHALPPLAPAEVEQLVGALLAGVADDHAALAAQVQRRAGGNPFFVVSCTQALRQTGAAPGDDTLPWDAAQSIRQRVAALPVEAQEVLEVAALVGRIVPPALVTQVAGQLEPAVLEALDAAYRARLVIEADDGYHFAHDLIREVVEAGVGRGRRMALHRRIAEALAAQATSTTTEPPFAALAYHFGRSGAWDNAARYLEQAGDRAKAQVALAAAEGYYREAVGHLDRLGSTADAARVREKLGGILFTTLDLNGALAALEQAAETLRIAGDLDGLGRVLDTIGNVHVWRGTVPDGLAHLEPLLGVFEARGPSSGLGGIHCGLAAVYFERGRFREALAAHARAVEIARLLGDDRLLAKGLIGCGESLVFMGRDPEALPLLREGCGLAEAAGELEELCYVLLLTAWIYEERGEFAACKACATRALTLAERPPFPLQVADATLRLAALALCVGEWRQARTHVERATALADLSPYLDVMLLLDRGRVAMAEGAWEEATRYLEACSAAARRGGLGNQDRVAESLLAECDVLERRPEAALARLLPLLDRDGMEERIVTTHVLPVLAWAHLEHGDTAQAARTIADAIRRARASQYRLALVGALRVQALVAMRQGDVRAAEDALDESLALARPMPYPYGEGRLLYVYGLLHLWQGAPERARARLEAALAIFRRLGARKDVERAEAVLATIVDPGNWTTEGGDANGTS